MRRDIQIAELSAGGGSLMVMDITSLRKLHRD
jgi:hypothetical protein